MVAFLLWLAVCIGGVLIINNYFQPISQRIKNQIIRTTCEFFIALGFIALVASPLYFEYPNYGCSRVVTFDGNCAVERPFGAFAWEFSRTFSNIPVRASNISYTSPRTYNRYTISTAIYNPEAFFKSNEWRHSFAVFPWGNMGKLSVAQEIESITAYSLIEFDVEFGQQLAIIDGMNKNNLLALRTFTELCLNAKLAQHGIMVTTVDLQ